MSFQTSPFDLTTTEIKHLADLAIAAKQHAYCPYSSFQVGAAILYTSPTTSSPQYSTGANVEIASTPVGICAERCALAPLVASNSRPFPPDSKETRIPLIRGIAVATNIDPPASPCGMCRQFMREFVGEGVKVMMYGKNGYVEGDNKDGRVDGAVVMTMGQLLPMSFGPNDLERNPEKANPKFG